MKCYFKFIYFYFFLGFGFTFIITNNAFSQEPAAEEEFNDLGLISYSNNYKVAPELDHITFRIKNQSTLTINKIFAWVYHISEDEEGNPQTLSLVNNPHRGGVLSIGNPHRPGDIAEWRFPLFKALTKKKVGNKYALRASHKGIFFNKVEPSAKSTKKP
jgi:hypothetical protein